MAKGFMHTGEPTVGERGSFDKLADGMYPVSGISKFISKGAAGEPVFSNQYGDLKVSFEFKVVGSDLGVACSMTPADFYAMALAFGVDLKYVTPKNRQSSAIIQQTADLINKTTKNLTASAKNGWVRYVVGVQPPEGLYTLRFKDMRRGNRSEGLEFLQGEYGPSLLVEFEIVGDGIERETVWNGAVIAVSLGDPFVDSAVQADGTTVTAAEAGIPLFASEEGKDGLRHATRTALKWHQFIEFFAPEALEHVWQTDPAKSRWGVNELASPQYVIAGYAKETPRTAKLLFNMGKNKRVVDLMDLSNLNPKVVEEVEEEYSPALGDLIRFITDTYGADVFVDIAPENGVFEFTPKGKTWAKDTMQPAWEAAGLGKKRALHLLSEDEIGKLLAELKPEVSEETEEPESW